MFSSPNVSQKPTRCRDTFTDWSIYSRQAHARKFERELRLKRSNEAIIFRLPPEITAKIFKLVQILDDYKPLIHDSDLDYVHWCWLTITHICKVWRGIAIATEDLWTYIDTGKLSGTDQTTTYLKRSGNSLLSVHYDYALAEELAIRRLQRLYLALAHIQRIRELHISGLPGHFPDELRYALSHNTAPALQNFTLTGDTEGMFDPKTLFKGDAPNLRALYLSTNSNSWASVPIMQNLNFLRIGTFSGSLNLLDAYSILLENPNIENFSVNSMYTLAHRNDSRMLPLAIPIELAALRNLNVAADYTTLDILLKSIATPNLVNWECRCKDYPIKSNLESHPRNIVPSVIGERKCKSLELALNSFYVEIKANYYVYEKENWDNGFYPEQLLKYSWNDEEQAIEAISVSDSFHLAFSVIEGGFWCFTRHLAIEIQLDGTNVQDLFLDENEAYLLWLRLLKVLPAIEVLAVHVYNRSTNGEGTHRGLLKALKYTDAEDNGTTHLICPNLADLQISGIDLKAGLSYLVEVLRFRASNGRRLNWLNLLDVLGSEEEASRLLRGLAGKIDIMSREWDEEWDEESYGEWNEESDEESDRHYSD